MKLEGYNVEKDRYELVYWFYSEGPKGRIKKTIRFQHKPLYGRNFFNLAFGDSDGSTDRMNDLVISNNGDHLKVLYTVAAVVREFINCWPNAIIQIQGSTSSRTRLYQMGISSFWQEIIKEFEVYGELGQNWEPFKKGINYKRFLVFKKIR
jgi:hypothetical protein